MNIKVVRKIIKKKQTLITELRRCGGELMQMNNIQRGFVSYYGNEAANTVCPLV